MSLTVRLAGIEPVSGPSRKAIRRRMATVVVILLGLVLALFVVSMMLGSSFITPGAVIDGLLGRGSGSSNFVVRELRLPRSVAAIVIGLALGASGTMFQRVLGNHLASPDLLGVASGAGTAAAAWLILGTATGTSLTIAATFGAVATAAATYVFAWRRGITGYRFILVGIGISVFASSLTSYLIARADFTEARAATHWLIGSVGMASRQGILILTGVCALVALLGPAITRRLALLELGEDAARGLGSGVQLDRLLVIACAVILVGTATAIAGPIAFVALLAGPLAGFLLGTAGASVTAAALMGAVVTQVADLGAQYALPWPISTGIVTGFIGAPYIVWLIVRANREGMGA